MTQNLPEKLLQQRLRLQLVSLESPTELPGSSRNYTEMGVSPMTELANNLGDTSLGITPLQDSKRRLSMDSESSGSTPSPPDRLLVPPTNADTPLSSITNIPKRILLHSNTAASSSSSSNKAALLPEDPENKENIIPFASFLSPGKRRSSSSSSSSSCSSSSGSSVRSIGGGGGSSSSPRCHQLIKLGVSPAKAFPSLVGRPRPPAAHVPSSLPAVSSMDMRRRPQQQAVPFNIFNDDDETEEHRNAAATFVPPLGAATVVTKSLDDNDGSDMEICCDNSSKEQSRSIEPGSMEDILTDCSPGKEDGVAPLGASPERAEPAPADSTRTSDDGFGLEALATINEDSEAESPRFDLSALLSKKIILPSHLESSALYQQPSCDASGQPRPPVVAAASKPPPPRCSRPVGGGGFKRPLFRRALSMLDPPTAAVDRSSTTYSRGGAFDFNIPRFKRPIPPGSSCDSERVQQSQSKRRKCSPSSLMSEERSVSMEEEEQEQQQQGGQEENQGGAAARPKLHRSHSENELSIMKSCQLKEEVENILPDSSRLYALPCVSHDSKHPSLRSISCDTLAHLINGKYNHLINSYRIIDARYAFEYEGGHIRGAENWQHGEDEEFLSAFLPSQPLAGPPAFCPTNTTKRDILIFHCEFSSQRGPDFYRKLRERDRQLNQHVYPALYYPEVYLLHLGYKEFFSLYPDLCTGRYTTMVDPNHEHDLRKMRAKSKSWSGGTITRTGRMGRLHL